MTVNNKDRHTPRSAAMLLSEALNHLDLLEPPGAREPVRHMIRAAIELCATSHSLLGKPVVPVLDLAQALVAHGWRPPLAMSTGDVVNVNGDLFEVIEWSLKDHDIDGDGTHEWTLYAHEVSK